MIGEGAARRLTARIERWPVAGSFVIARGPKSHVDVVLVEIVADGLMGRGEATPIYYHGETAESVLAEIEAAAAQIGHGIGRAELLSLMPRGAARNALDCALWDLEAKMAARPVWSLAGLVSPRPLQSAFTISLGPPAAMEGWRSMRATRTTCRWAWLGLGATGEAPTAGAVRGGARRGVQRCSGEGGRRWVGR